jgi:hypothetical protein
MIRNWPPHLAAPTLGLLLIALGLGACQAQGTGSNRDEAKEVVVEVFEAALDKDRGEVRERIHPAQRDSGTVDEIARIGDKDLPSFLEDRISIETDTAVLKNGYGYVRTRFTRPDVEQIVQAHMDFSEQMALAAAQKEGNQEAVKERIQRAMKKAKENEGEIPTKPLTVKVNVADPGGGWKMVDRDAVLNRVDRGQKAVQNLNLDEARTALARAEKMLPRHPQTEELAKAIKNAEHEITYADSVDIEILSQKTKPALAWDSQDRPYARMVQGKVRIENRGSEPVHGLRFERAIDVKHKSVGDTTVVKTVRWSFSEDHAGSAAALGAYNYAIQPQESDTLKYKVNVLNPFDPQYDKPSDEIETPGYDAKIISEYRINEKKQALLK